MARSGNGPYGKGSYNGFVGSDPRADRDILFSTPYSKGKIYIYLMPSL